MGVPAGTRIEVQGSGSSSVAACRDQPLPPGWGDGCVTVHRAQGAPGAMLGVAACDCAHQGSQKTEGDR